MSTYSVVFEGTPVRFDAPGNQTILASAAEARFEIASSCRTGTCRTCLRRLVSGTVRYEIPWPGLSPDEKQDGYFLPCVAYPTSDLSIGEGVMQPWWDTSQPKPR